MLDAENVDAGLEVVATGGRSADENLDIWKKHRKAGRDPRKFEHVRRKGNNIWRKGIKRQARKNPSGIESVAPDVAQLMDDTMMDNIKMGVGISPLRSNYGKWKKAQGKLVLVDTGALIRSLQPKVIKDG